MRRHPIALAAALALVTVGHARAEAKPLVAVLGLEVVTADGSADAQASSLARQLTDALRQRVAANGPYALAPNSSKDLLEMKLLSGCADEGKKCMTAIGAELGADRLLYGKVKRASDGFQLTLTLLDIGTGGTEKVEERIPLDGTKAAALSIRARAVYARLTGASGEGTLLITANVSRGRILLDGKEIQGGLVGGKKRVTGLGEGRYPLAIEAAGHLRYEGSVAIIADEETVVEAQLEANGLGSGNGVHDDGADDGGERPGGFSRVAVWPAAALTLLGGAAIIVTGLQVRDYEDQKFQALTDLDESGITIVGDDACSQAKGLLPEAQAVVDACDKGMARRDLTNILVGGTIVAAAATAIFYYKGYISPPPTKTEKSPGTASTRKKKRQQAVVFQPVVLPTQVSAGVTIEF